MNTYLVCFCKTGGSYWQKLFTLHRPFDHVFCIKYDTQLDVYLFIEWSSWNLNIEALNQEQFNDVMKEIFEKNFTVVKYKSKVVRQELLFGKYCVSIIKKLLGVRGFVFTPYQLYKYLLNNGGILVNV